MAWTPARHYGLERDAHGFIYGWRLRRTLLTITRARNVQCSVILGVMFRRRVKRDGSGPFGTCLIPEIIALRGLGVFVAAIVGGMALLCSGLNIRVVFMVLRDDGTTPFQQFGRCMPRCQRH